MPANEVESWVLERIDALIFGGQPLSRGDLSALEAEIAARLASGPSNVEEGRRVKELERRLEEKRKKVKLLVEALDAETLDLVREELKALKREIRALEDEVREARTREESRSDEDPRRRARRIASRLVEIKRVMENGTPEERREFVRQFVSGIKVDPEKGELEVDFFSPEGSDGEIRFWGECPQRDSNPCNGLEKPVS